MMKKLPSLFKSRADDEKSRWAWASCRQPRTLSFRTNTVAAAAAAATDSSDSFTVSSESTGSPTTEWDLSGSDPIIEKMIRNLGRSERLIMEPAGKSRSIVKEEKIGGVSWWSSAGVLSMDSDDPFWDFKKSMGEMVEAYGMKDWECLEELLSWYLRVNGRNNHGFIIAAFVDLLLTLSISDSISPFSVSSSSSSSFLPSTASSSSMEVQEITSLHHHHHHHHLHF